MVQKGPQSLLSAWPWALVKLVVTTGVLVSWSAGAGLHVVFKVDKDCHLIPPPSQDHTGEESLEGPLVIIWLEGVT